MRSVILTGFMGTGKSSVGRILAQMSGLIYLDLDALIVSQAGRSINEKIFALTLPGKRWKMSPLTS
jgi:shikimate kinase